MRRYLALVTLPFLLQGCVAAAVGAGTEAGVSLAEERSVGTKVDDVTIYSDINRLYMKEPTNDIFANITVNVRHGRVLLTGAAKTQDQAAKAVLLAWQARSVKEVINEIIVDPNYSFSQGAQDSLVQRNLEGRLLVTKGVWVINYSIDVVKGVVYLLGRTTDQAEMDKALNIARTTKGVKRVVNYLQLKPDTAPPAHITNSGGYTQAPAPVSNPQPAPTGSYNSNFNNYGTAPASNTPYYGGGSSSGAGDGYEAPQPVNSAPLPPAN